MGLSVCRLNGLFQRKSCYFADGWRYNWTCPQFQHAYLAPARACLELNGHGLRSSRHRRPLSPNSCWDGPRTCGRSIGERAACGFWAARLITHDDASHSHSKERIPVIGLGTANGFQYVQEGEKRAALKKVIDELLAGGGTVIDTASSYGSAESVLGSLISDQDRAKVFLATKLENGDSQSGTPEFRRSLERLRMKSVDLLQLHNVKNPKRSLAAFRDWKEQGLCKYIGITTTYDRDYDAAEAILRREKPDFFEVDYSIDNRETEKRLLPAAAEIGAAVLIALPFGRSSLFRAVRGKSVPEWAKEFDATTWSQFFLKFLLANEAVTAVIPGTNNPQHMVDNLAAGRGRFPDAKQRQAMVAFFETL